MNTPASAITRLCTCLLSLLASLSTLLAPAQAQTNPPPLNWSLKLPGSQSLSPLFQQGGLVFCEGYEADSRRFFLCAVRTNGVVAWVRDNIARPSMDAGGIIYGIPRDSFGDSALVTLDSENRLLGEYGSLPISPSSTLIVLQDSLIGMEFKPVYVGHQLQFNDLILYRLSKQGQVLWRKIAINGASAFEPAPAVSQDGKIYVSAKGFLYCFNLDGQELWQYGLLSVGTYFSPVVDPSGTVYVQNQASLIAVTPDGKTKWQSKGPFGGIDGRGVILAHGLIYAAWGDGIYCFLRDGTLQRRIPLKSNSLSFRQPAISSDGLIVIILPNDSGPVLGAFDFDGAVQWAIPEIGSDFVLGDDGTIYVSQQGTLYAYAGTAPGPHPWPMEGRTPERRNIGLGSALSGEKSPVGFVGRISSEGSGALTLQASEDLRIWRDLTNYPAPPDRPFADRTALTNTHRFFRLRH